MNPAACADNDKPAPACATPPGCPSPTPRLRVVLDGPPAVVLALLRSMGQPLSGRRGPKLSAETAAAIRKRLESGESREVLAREFKVTLATVKNLATGRTYPETASA